MLSWHERSELSPLVSSHSSASPSSSEVMCPKMLRRILKVSKAWNQLIEVVLDTSGERKTLLGQWNLMTFVFTVAK